MRDVYVVEAMKLNRRSRRRYRGDLVCLFADDIQIIYDHVELISPAIQKQTAVVLTEPKFCPPPNDGELVSFRRIGEWEEIFECDKGTWVLRTDEVVTVAPDTIARELFAGGHGEVFHDAGMHVSDAIFEILLEKLTEDYERCHNEPWPSVLSECIVDVLRGKNSLEITRSDIAWLETEVVDLFNRQDTPGE